MTFEQRAERGSSMGKPETRFAQAGDVNIGYQVVGDGPVDLVWAWGWISNIEVFWEEPSCAAFLRRLSEFSRLILFDGRGRGISDRGSDMVTPTLEERMADVLAVLDAVGSERASIFGVSEGGNLATLLAATYPERVVSIVVYGTVSRFLKDAEHPWGWGDDAMFTALVEEIRRTWGTPNDLAVQMWAPTMVGDDRFSEWMAKFARQSLSRRDVVATAWSMMDYDLVDVFPAVRTPTLVVHRRDDQLIPVSHGRWIAEHIPDAQLVELEGIDHFPFVGESEEVLAAIEEFLIGSPTAARRHRKLLTVMFTDIADSSMMLTTLGDNAWSELLASHDRMVRDHLARFEGQEMKHLGDGFLAVFDGPARAIRCAMGIVDAAGRLGLSVRIGVHTGECELVEDDVRGITVHVGARIAELAAKGQILASNSVRDLVAGSGIRFGEGQDVELQGIAGPRVVFPVLSHGATPEAVRRLAGDRTNLLRLDGEYWTVAYDGHVVTLRDSKGLRDIARLLASPGREFHVLDLIAEADVEIRPSDAEVIEAGLHVQRSSSDALVDETARARYRLRISELRQEVDDADAAGNATASAKAREELEALVEQLGSAYGIGGKARRTPDHVERARKAVARRIRDAVSRVQRAHPGLGKHLTASLHTGVFCRYEPDHAVSWELPASWNPGR